jgi:hypothetical protein
VAETLSNLQEKSNEQRPEWPIANLCPDFSFPEKIVGPNKTKGASDYILFVSEFALSQSQF